MSETRNLKQLASHFVALNATRNQAISAGLLNSAVNVIVDTETIYLKPNVIGTLETRTVKNDKKEDVQQARINNHTFEEYIDTPETLFSINKAIFTKLNLLINFELDGEHSEFNMYL